ncbi:uncharacterized protein LOC115771147 [Drosophila novamexicana]|uniref:Uncharacterized protein n=1 Tax=Drosophila virilis TaxID=7244 RepID=B4LFH5_DROVI|nr:uncharacterized protein LOC6622239 [Drosophila virilis]XP_030572578.1 uncharacterized protein LOC115771147 [Drosophila novamexicana]EDW69273.1 uncharacterized protein Dvir_GJ13153 [Drosophila virilis]
MKYIVLALFVCLLAVALVAAVPVDESLQGDNIYGQADVHNPHDPQAIFKLKKLKKLLLG